MSNKVCLLYNNSQYYNTLKKPSKSLPLYEIDGPLSPREWLHPAKFCSGSFSSIESFTWDLYTDGSKFESGKVGCAFVVFKTGSISSCVQRKFQLANWCSNNQAELLAIAKALEWIEENQNLRCEKTARIWTDSQVSIQTIKNSRKHHRLAEKIRSLLYHLTCVRGWHIVIEWVKAHAGTTGNELADRLAKEAAADETLDVAYYYVPISYVSSSIKAQGLVHWEKEWSDTDKGSHTKKFFPTIKARLVVEININYKITQVLSGHGRNKAYLYRFSLTDNDACNCPDGCSQTWEHLIFSCSNLESHRVNLLQDVVLRGLVWPPSLCDLISQWKSFERFVNSIDFEQFR